MAGEPSLAERIRAKYPGVYDDMDDAALESKVRAKFPGVYDDIPSSAARASVAAPVAPPQAPGFLNTAGNVAATALDHTPAGPAMMALRAAGVSPESIFTGQAKGALNTVAGLGDMVDAASASTGLFERDADDFDAVRAMTAPSNAQESVGRTGEQLAEFLMVPGPGKVKGAARALELAGSAAANAGLTGAQTGSGAAAATAGGLSAALPPAVQGAAKGAKYLGDRMVRAVVKPTVAAMRRITGSGERGLDAKANQLVDFIIRNGITSAEKAQRILTESERELQRVMSLKNAPTDAATRAKRYIEALEKNARKAALGEEAVGAFRSKMGELLRGPMGEDVVEQVSRNVDTGLVDTAGSPIMREAVEDVTKRGLRAEVPAREALESARASNAFKSNPQNVGENATLAARQAVERAQRDAVKAAVPEARKLLRTEANAITARDVLDRGALREGNQNLAGIAGAVEVGTGRAPILGFAARLLREGQLGAGVKVGQLARAVQEGHAGKVAFYLQKLGVSLPAQLAGGRASVAGPVR